MHTYPDKFVWRCAKCHNRESVRAHSFWAGKQKLSIQNYILLLYFFSIQICPLKAHYMVPDVSIHTIYDWYNFYRDLMSKELLENTSQIGGADDIVEIDESKWGRKRKYNRGRVCGEKPWIFGMISRKSGKVILEQVPRRDKETLIPIIIRHVHPQSTIFHDDWAAYRELHVHGYNHDVVNHSENFVNPNTGAHTQTIEGFWQKAKNPFKNMHGQTNDKIPIYLDEVVFRWNNKGKDMFKLMISLISKHYNPNSHLPAEGIPNDIVY